MTDPYEIVRQLLSVASNSFLTHLGGTYFSPDVVPSGFTNTHKAVVYHVDGGDLHVSGSLHSPTIVFKCYGGTQHASDAREVALALVDYLQVQKAVALTEGQFHKATLSQFFAGPPDPQGWPVFTARFAITTEGI